MFFSVKTLLERLQHVMDATDLNPSSWSLKAGLSRDHVRQAFLKSYVDMHAGSLSALAAVTPFAFEWLATGQGKMFRAELDVPDDPKYPGRAGAIVAARLCGYREEAIQAVVSLNDIDRDPGVEYWLSLMRAKDLEYAHAPSTLVPPHNIR